MWSGVVAFVFTWAKPKMLKINNNENWNETKYLHCYTKAKCFTWLDGKCDLKILKDRNDIFPLSNNFFTEFRSEDIIFKTWNIKNRQKNNKKKPKSCKEN